MNEMNGKDLGGGEILDVSLAKPTDKNLRAKKMARLEMIFIYFSILTIEFLGLLSVSNSSVVGVTVTVAMAVTVVTISRHITVSPTPTSATEVLTEICTAENVTRTILSGIR